LSVRKKRQVLTLFAAIEYNHKGYENVGHHIDSGAADDFRSSLYRPASDKRTAGHAKGELKSLGTLGTISMLSVDQFLRLISLPAIVAAFLIASQISGGVFSGPAQVASDE
jgi:hypothetical protein